MDYKNPQELKQNSYSREIFPLLEGARYKFLKRDIQERSIQTPIEITKDNVILCGHERVRIALDLGLAKVPVIVFDSNNDTKQKLRIILDNLARKNVDFETQFKCFQELKRLYGLERGEAGKLRRPKGSKGFVKRSKERYTKDEEIPVMTEEEIAKEVGLDATTFRRAQKIQESTLPKEIKEAVFEGDLAVRPVAELLDKPEKIQHEVCKTILTDLQHNPRKKIAVTKIVNSVENEDTNRLMKDNIEKARELVERMKGTIQKVSLTDKQKADAVNHLVCAWLKENLLKCPKCGKSSNLKWGCCNEKF